MVRHAIASEDKRARRERILEAAGALFVAGDGSLPTAAQIGTAAALAKGTVYLYFRTKEEIFATLLLEGWGALMARVHATLQAAGGRRADKVAAFLASFGSHLDEHPELLRLDALGYGVLEKNLDVATLGDFKLAFLNQLVSTGAALDTALRLTSGRGLQILMRTYALTRGLWQSHRHAEECKVDIDPAITPPNQDFGVELREALAEYWRGALASH